MKPQTMKLHSLKITIVIGTLLGVFCFAPCATNAASIWDGGGADNNWTTPENWNLDTAPANDGTADITFAGSTRLTPTISGTQSVLKVTFDSGASGFNVSSGTLTLNSAGNAVANAVITNNSSALQTISSTISFGAAAGNSIIYSPSGAISITGNIVNNNTRKLVIRGAEDVSISGNVSGAGNSGFFLLESGFTGTFTLSGSNTYTGSNVIRSGTLKISSDNALGAGTADVQIGVHGATDQSLLIGGAYTTDKNVLAGNSATTITIGGDTADTSIYSGTIKLGDTAGRAIRVTAAEGGTVRFDGNLVTSVSGSDDLDAVTKVGSGTVILGGAENTYSGTTTVSAGTLLVNGTYTTSGDDISVAATAAFGGMGSVNREVSIVGDASLIAGDGASVAGTLTLSNDLTLGDNSTIRFVLGESGAHSTLARAGGIWSFDGDQLFSINSGASAGNYSGIITGLTGSENGLASIASWSIDDPAYASSYFTFDDGNVSLHVVPEPAACLLVGLGLGLCLINRCARRK